MITGKYAIVGKVVEGAEFKWQPAQSKQHVTISGTGARTFYLCLAGGHSLAPYLKTPADKAQVLRKLRDMGFTYTDTTAAPAPVATAATLRPQLHVPAT